MKNVFQHLHLFCRELEPMVAFWVEAFGAELVERRKMGAAEGAELLLTDTLRLFIRGAGPADVAGADASSDTSVLFSGFDHVGFAVDSMDAALSFLAKRDDVAVERPPFISGPNRCAFIRGPEGVRIELVEPNFIK